MFNSLHYHPLEIAPLPAIYAEIHRLAILQPPLFNVSRAITHAAKMLFFHILYLLISLLSPFIFVTHIFIPISRWKRL
jgi:hypothetical protein